MSTNIINGKLTVTSSTGDAKRTLQNTAVASSFKPAATGSSVGIDLGDVTLSAFSGAASTISSATGSSFFQAKDSYLGSVSATGGMAGGALVALKNAPTLSSITFTSKNGINNIDANIAGVTLKATGSQTSTQMVVGVGGSVDGSLSQSIADGISSFFGNSEDSTYTLSTDAEDLARYFYKSDDANGTNIDLGTVAFIHDQPVGAISLSATKGLAALLIADSRVVSKIAGTISSGDDFALTSATPSAVSVSGQSAVMYGERMSTGTLTLRATTGDATARLNSSGVASSFKPAATGSSVGIDLGDVTLSAFSGAASTISSATGSSFFQAKDSYLGSVSATGGMAGGALVALKNAPTLSSITFTSKNGINNIDANIAGVTLKATGSQTSTQMVVGVGGSVDGSLSQSIADGISSFFGNSEDSTYTLSTDAEDLARYFYKSDDANGTNIDLGTVAFIHDQPVGAISLSATKGLAALLIADSRVVSKIAGTISSGDDFALTSATPSAVSVSGQSAVMYGERVYVGRINLTATSKIDLSLIDSFVLNSTTFSSLGEISSFTAGTISLQSQTAEVMLNDSYFGTLDLTKVSGVSNISVLFDGSNTAIANLPDGYRPQVALKASNGVKDTIKLFESSPYSGKYTVTGFELGKDELYNNNQIISYSGNKFSNDAVTIVGSSIVIDFAMLS